jgi:hypothetical protein
VTIEQDDLKKHVEKLGGTILFVDDEVIVELPENPTNYESVMSLVRAYVDNELLRALDAHNALVAFKVTARGQR